MAKRERKTEQKNSRQDTHQSKCMRTQRQKLSSVRTSQRPPVIQRRIRGCSVRRLVVLTLLSC
eukprot:11313912-Prorocentrum_lima.AAC.1